MSSISLGSYNTVTRPEIRRNEKKCDTQALRRPEASGTQVLSEKVKCLSCLFSLKRTWNIKSWICSNRHQLKFSARLCVSIYLSYFLKSHLYDSKEARKEKTIIALRTGEQTRDYFLWDGEEMGQTAADVILTGHGYGAGRTHPSPSDCKRQRSPGAVTPSFINTIKVQQTF